MGKRLRFIWSLALPYAVTIFLPVVAVLVLAGRVTADYREKIVEDRRESAESAFERFSRRMDNVVTLSYMIASAPVRAV